MTIDRDMMALSEAQAALASDVLDQVVPAGDGFPGAGELGVVRHLDEAAGADPKLERLLADGLTAIETASRRMHGADFADLADGQKAATLKQVEAESPRFFETLVRQTYAGYYTDSRVIELLGLEARPPQPLGFHLQPFDSSMVENARKRGKIWRDA